MIRKLSELLHPRGFFDALWPYRNISILFSHCNSASKMWRRIYGASMISVYLTVSYFTSYELYKSFIEQHGYHAQFFLVYFAFWSQPIIIMIHTLTWAFVGHACYKKVISYSTLVDQELVRVCSKHVNLKMMVMRQLVCLTLSVLLPVAQAVLHILSRSDAITWGNVIRIGIIHYPDTVTNVVGSLFGNLVYLTGDRYALINSALEGIGKLNRNDAALTIRQLRIVHQKLLFVSRNITEAFAVQTVACVFSALVHSVYNLFSVYKIQASSRGGSDIDNTFHSAIGIVGDLAIVVYVAYCCDRTVKEANGTTKILSSMVTTNEDLQMEISSFSYQLMHCQLNFSPLGLFHLDLTLLQSMAGLMATYLIILVQMGSDERAKNVITYADLE